MSKILIYSCVFYNENYIKLLDMLLKSYNNYGKPSNNITYLIITNVELKEKIESLLKRFNMIYDIWCLNLHTKFEATYSRLKIFDYQYINNYEKILYLDTDILITNKIENILKFNIENKLYVLKEGNTSEEDWGKNFFKENNKNIDGFTTGIMLFNNNRIIKSLFNDILIHIYEYISKDLKIPSTYEQPFVIFHAMKNNLYNNTKLIDIVINNPEKYNNETISHFPGGVGDYQSKIVKMTNFYNIINKIND